MMGYAVVREVLKDLDLSPEETQELIGFIREKYAECRREEYTLAIAADGGTYIGAESFKAKLETFMAENVGVRIVGTFRFTTDSGIRLCPTDPADRDELARAAFATQQHLDLLEEVAVTLPSQVQ
jgi:hypothetical protein